MSSSAIIDLAIGLTFVFGVRAALSSALTELIARLTGLCGAYLLSGLRELVQQSGTSVVLGDTAGDYAKTRKLMGNLEGLKPVLAATLRCHPENPAYGSNGRNAQQELYGHVSPLQGPADEMPRTPPPRTTRPDRRARSAGRWYRRAMRGIRRRPG